MTRIVSLTAHALAVAAVAVSLLAACKSKTPAAPKTPAPVAAPSPAPAQPTPAAPVGPTVAEATQFIAKYESDMLAAYVHRDRTQWVRMTHITHDTDLLGAAAEERVMEMNGERSAQATRFDKLDLPPDVRRKFYLLKATQVLPAPKDATKRSALATAQTEMESAYGKGKYCGKDGKTCRDLGKLSDVLAKSRNYDELLDAWSGWRTVSAPMRKTFEGYVELGNEGARELGFANLGDLWKGRYDMPAAEFEAEVDRLWSQVKPLYEQLHCYARAKLADKYGKDKVPEAGPLPAHLLGNMWGQEWTHIIDVLAPEKGETVDLTKALEKRKTDAIGMVKYGEAFFTSLGLVALPKTFWERSLFNKPADREVVCHASAWDVDQVEDLRIKMCIKINDEDFTTIHHELGHNYYQYYYRKQPMLFRESANDGFHEGLGDTIALSVTPAYLKKLGLIDKAPQEGAIGELMQRALQKIAFLPFGLVVDKWRWDVFAGKTTPANYNAAWWALVKQYQGMAPATPRGEDHFDPGAKYHVPANVPYTRYFLAAILQYQFHRALCKIAGHTGPLHACSIYGNKAAGDRLVKMMEMGQSRPWPEALAALSGERKMDASAIIDYYKPLSDWLQKANTGRKCGW